MNSITRTANLWSAMAGEQKESSPQNPNDLVYDLVQKESYVGEVINLNYSEAVVQIHDFYRQKVGGIALGSFLIATRINPELNEDVWNEEDGSVILLRVTSPVNLFGEQEKERIRIEAAEKVGGTSDHWDSRGVMDERTNSILSFSGVKCKVMGTFYVDQINDEYKLQFGSDISNYSPNKGLKIYKPSGEALEKIVNYGVNNHKSSKVRIGSVRYASTQRQNQYQETPVYLSPKDLVAKKTAVFGMTRTGKSNTVKTLIKAIYLLRFESLDDNIGMLVFDPNGEYANENLQDNGSIKNVWRSHKQGKKQDIKTYGLFEHSNDPDRIMMKVNFYSDTELKIGKDLIDKMLQEQGSNSSIYIDNFMNIDLTKPDPQDHGGQKRYERKVLAYKTLLAKAGFVYGNELPKYQGLFSKKFKEYLQIGIKNLDDLPKNEKLAAEIQIDNFRKVSEILEQPNSSWEEMSEAMNGLREYIENPMSTYSDFNDNYRKNDSSSGDNWADDDLKKMLAMFKYPNGSRQLGKARVFHNIQSGKDYADIIYRDLEEGKLVIVDQSTGEDNVHKVAAERIMWRIFQQNSKKFSQAAKPSNIIAFIEEAHNLLPRGGETDNTNIWARVAKEGAKFNIGLTLSTQEISSIQKSILKNTSNWFISHLNNQTEVRELADYYDFSDFSESILKAQDKGFLRVKTESNPFIVPTQIDKFVI